MIFKFVYSSLLYIKIQRLEDKKFKIICGGKMSKYCFKCGKMLDDLAVYCTSCGEKQVENVNKNIGVSDETTLNFQNLEEFIIYIELFSHKIHNKINWINDNKVTDLYQNAYELFEKKKFNESIEIHRKILELNPIAIRSRFEIVECLIGLNNVDEAEKELNKIKKYLINPVDVGRYYRRLAYLHIEKKQYELARNLLYYSLFIYRNEKDDKIVLNELMFIDSELGNKIKKDLLSIENIRINSNLINSTLYSFKINNYLENALLKLIKVNEDKKDYNKATYYHSILNKYRNVDLNQSSINKDINKNVHKIKDNNNWKKIILGLAGVFLLWLFFTNGATNEEFSKPIVSKPTSGIYQNHLHLENVAPLKIITKEGNGSYFMKIKDDIGLTVMTIFINDGETVDIKVPLGTYKILSTNGEDWYGQDYLFGPDTSYSKLKESFNFKLEGNRYIGHNLYLYKQNNGNLREVSISKSEWE